MQQLDTHGPYDDPIVTEIVPAAIFWRAEEYHQKYIQKTNRPAAAYKGVERSVFPPPHHQPEPVKPASAERFSPGLKRLLPGADAWG